MADVGSAQRVNTPELVWPGGASAVGPHRVEGFALCPQLEGFSQEMHLRPLIEKDATMIGTLVHVGTAYRYGAMLPEKPDWLVYPDARTAIWVLGCGSGREDAAIEALRVFDAYEAWYRTNVWRPVLVEHQFRVEMGPQSLLYTARIDLLVIDEYNQYALVDHKTVRELSKGIGNGYRTDRQMLTGLALARAAGYDVKRVIINALSKERPEPRFWRYDVPISSEAYGRLGQDTLYYLQQMDAVRKAYPDPTQRPRNTGACVRKYGRCDFYPLCSEGLHHIDQFVKR